LLLEIIQKIGGYATPNFLLLCGKNYLIMWLCVHSQGSLVEKLSTPASYPNIDTLEQLDSSGMWIAVRHQGLIVDLFGDEQPGTPLGGWIFVPSLCIQSKHQQH
jgi:hypothetical protein